ncbi:MAG: hypothetical protein CMJ58_19890 [Planctomycetaceae bacterium]|nr:hypothetical protein [Planctomycetaceae bacterium]
MNKAFVREPDDTGRVYCPRCKSLGSPVEAAPLDRYVAPAARNKLGAFAWFCPYQHCEAAYFNQFDVVVTVDELTEPVYPKDLDAPLCACFGYTYDDAAADVAEGQPTRTRELIARTKTPEARCRESAPSGQCCVAAVQELYLRLRNP